MERVGVRTGCSAHQNGRHLGLEIAVASRRRLAPGSARQFSAAECVKHRACLADSYRRPPALASDRCQSEGEQATD